MSVLLLHANVAERDYLIAILCKQGFGPVQAFSAIEEFLETAACACAGQPACEAILVDLAVDSSLVACVEIRGITKVVPILVLFDESSGAHLEAAFKAGATDCLSKPINPLELTPRLHSSARKCRSGQGSGAQEHSNQTVQFASDRSFQQGFERAWRRAQVSHSPLSLLVINVDNLAQYNQVYGRAAGDECLERVMAAVVAELFHRHDVVFHRGSGEFVIVVAGADRNGAAVVAERLRKRVFGLGIPHAGSPVHQHLTISLGQASAIPSSGLAPEDLLFAAESALSEAKLAGRNRLVMAEDVAITC